MDKYNYIWKFNFLKNSEGGPELKDFGKNFSDKPNGVWAYMENSCYIGHKRVVIMTTTRKSMNIALKKLKSWKLIETISEGRRGVVAIA